ncbi:hypothetical protein GX645_00775 [Candidatus Sumerlaeota bacterium]|nr:hypothetical protein [Candidatus Sumerlaeota bacterium]
MQDAVTSQSLSLTQAIMQITDHVSWIDVATLMLYILASFLIGIFATVWIKADNKKESGYFLGGRSISGWLAGTSIAVTAMNADVAPAYGGWMANTGLPMVWFYVVRFGVGQLVCAMLFCYMWRHMTISTGPEFFSLRYGGKGGTFTRVYSSLWGVFVGIVPWVGVGLLGVHKIFVPILWPDNPEFTKDPTLILILIMPILTIYVWKAGYSGVLATDFMQSVIIILANILACFLVLFHFGGPSGLREAIVNGRPGASIPVELVAASDVNNARCNVLWKSKVTPPAAGETSFFTFDLAGVSGVEFNADRTELKDTVFRVPPTGLSGKVKVVSAVPEATGDNNSFRFAVKLQNFGTAMPSEDTRQALSSLPVKQNKTINPWMCLPLFILCTMGVGGGMSTEGQRVMSCRTTKESMKSFIWAQIVLFLMLLSLTLPVMGLFPSNPELFHADPAMRENAYGKLLNDFMPLGFKGLALAAIAAAVMSTIASHLNYSSQTLVNDATRPFFPKITDRQGIMLGKFYMVLIMIASVYVTYHAQSMSGVAMKLAGLFGGGILLGWAQWWWWRTNFCTWVAAMVVGPVMFLCLTPILKIWPWWAEACKDEMMSQSLDLWQGLISLVICTSMWMIITLCTPHEDMKNLKEFYKRARPMGMWQPVRNAIVADGQEVPTQKPMIGFGFIIAIIGAIWIALLMLTLSHLYIGYYMKALLSGVICLATALLFKKLFNWYYERLGGDTDLPYQAEEESAQ